jgi:hypothetical protein
MVSSLSNYESKYSQSTLSKFDIIGSYFVNLYYNEFYTKAHTLRINGTYENVTDAYKNILSSYLDYTNKPEFFKQIIKGIHAYCISTTKYTTMTHKECIDFMINEFIPQKLWNSIRENQKNKLFHESINNSIKIFTADIISNHLVMIIDNHLHSENIIILQDLFLKIILLEKDKVYSKFLNPDNNNMISTELFKTKLLELVNDKKDLTNQNVQLKKNIEVLKQFLEKNSSVILELQKKNKENLKNIENLINKLNESNKKNTELQLLLSKQSTICKKEPISKNEKIHKLEKAEKDNNIYKVEKINNIDIIRKPDIKFNNKVKNTFTKKINKNKSLKHAYSNLLSDSDNESNNNSDNELNNESNNNSDNESDNELNTELDNKHNISDNNELEFDVTDNYDV